jgi:hypothetical protein
MVVLYNIITDKVIGYYPDGYKVNGKPASTNDSDVYELTVVPMAKPPHWETQKVVSNWTADIVAKTYSQSWNVIDKTAYELAMEGWQHPEFAKRIIAPIQLIMEDIGIKMYGWFQVNSFPTVSKGTELHLYCNTILPEHQSAIDYFQGLITIEDKPTQ